MKTWLTWTCKKSDHRLTKVRPKRRVMFFDSFFFLFFFFNPFTFCFYYGLYLEENYSVCWRYKLVFYEPVRMVNFCSIELRMAKKLLEQRTFISEMTWCFLVHWLMRLAGLGDARLPHR